MTNDDFPIELTSSDKNTMKAIGFSLDEILEDIEQIGVRYVKSDVGRCREIYMGPESQQVMDRLQAEMEQFRERVRTICAESIEPYDVAKVPV